MKRSLGRLVAVALTVALALVLPVGVAQASSVKSSSCSSASDPYATHTMQVTYTFDGSYVYVSRVVLGYNGSDPATVVLRGYDGIGNVVYSGTKAANSITAWTNPNLDLYRKSGTHVRMTATAHFCTITVPLP